TIKKVVELIENRWQIQRGHTTLQINNKQLPPLQTVENLNIAPHSTINVITNTKQEIGQDRELIPVFVNNTPNPTFKIQFSIENTTAEIKELISLELHTPSSQFYLTHKEKPLQDNTKAKKYNITPYTTIHMTYRLQGGTT